MDTEPSRSSSATVERIPTNVSGLDTVLNGGVIPGRAYMVRGEPGTGKTLLGLHFLSGPDSDDGGEGDALFINLGESESDIRQDAKAFGFDIEDISFLDLSPSSDFFSESESYTIFPSEAVEDESVTKDITQEVLDLEPKRVFVDPLTQFRYLSADEFQFREQVLSFLQFLKEQGCTVLFTSQNTPATPDDDLQFMSDGIISLGYDSNRRTIEVSKFRGSDFQGGSHSVTIDEEGMTVFPKLLPGKHSAEFDPKPLASGVPEIDEVLKGGLERGTVTILSGPSGVGKTTLGAQFMKEAAGRGERSVIYMFEESTGTFRHRCDSINIPVSDMMDRGTLAVEEMEALELTPEEFAMDVRRQVEEEGASIVMIDGIQGYRLALKGESNQLTNEIHAIGRYLQNMGVTTILIGEVSNITGEFQATDYEVSYLADNILFLRYLEFEGELRKAIGVLKKRAGDFERSLREFEITRHGIKVGEPLSNLRGILQGTPDWVDDTESDDKDTG